jgi:hypothetical protein
VSINLCCSLLVLCRQTNKHAYIQTTWRSPTYDNLCYRNTQQWSGSRVVFVSTECNSLHFSSKASLLSITQFRFTNALVIKSDVITLQGRWQPSDRGAVMPVHSINGTSADCTRPLVLKVMTCAAATRSQDNRTPKCIIFLTPKFRDSRTPSREVTVTYIVRTAAIIFSLFCFLFLCLFNLSVMEFLSSVSWFSFFLLSCSCKLYELKAIRLMSQP